MPDVGSLLVFVASRFGGLIAISIFEFQRLDQQPFRIREALDQVGLDGNDKRSSTTLVVGYVIVEPLNRNLGHKARCRYSMDFRSVGRRLRNAINDLT